MNKKKIFWIILLIIVIAMVGFIIYKSSNKDVTSNNETSNSDNVIGANKNTEEISFENNDEVDTTKYVETKLDDGILYSIDGQQYVADVVIGDNYYDTTINDMYYNPESYAEKNIEIEGFYLENSPYKFVARFCTSTVCPLCSGGYSYMEFQLDGNIDKTFTPNTDWIKIIGTLEKGNDESSYYEDYFYLRVLSIEVMNQRGQDTVYN